MVLFPITHTNNEVLYVERSGIEYSTKTTIYSYFGDEMNLDGRHSHLSRTRAGVMNIVHIWGHEDRCLEGASVEGQENGITFLVPIPK